MQVRQMAPRVGVPGVMSIAVLEAPQGAVRCIVPEPCVTIGLRFAASAALRHGARCETLPQATLSGLQLRARTIVTQPGGGMVMARLHPASARRLLGADPRMAVDCTLPLDRVADAAQVARALAEVKAAPDDAARAWVLERLLASLLAQAPAADPLAVQAVDRIVAAHGVLRIAQLAADLGASHDALGRRFAAAVGTTPKRFAMLVRLRAAIASHTPGAPLVLSALDAGFYDQAHFNGQLRRVAGLAPSQVLRPDSYC